MWPKFAFFRNINRLWERLFRKLQLSLSHPHVYHITLTSDFSSSCTPLCTRFSGLPFPRSYIQVLHLWQISIVKSDSDIEGVFSWSHRYYASLWSSAVHWEYIYIQWFRLLTEPQKFVLFTATASCLELSCQHSEDFEYSRYKIVTLNSQQMLKREKKIERHGQIVRCPEM